MNIADLNNLPFTHLPINGGDPFDLACEFLIPRLKRLYSSYNQILKNVEEITNSGDFKDAAALFNEFEQFIADYAQLINTVKLVSGQHDKSKQTLLNPFGYQFNKPIHYQARMARNTSEHFEERLQDHSADLDEFIKISYSGKFSWEAIFGNGGYKGSGYGITDSSAINPKQLIYHSFLEEKKQLYPVRLRFEDIGNDILAIKSLLEQNMSEAIMKQASNCAPPRNVSAILTP